MPPEPIFTRFGTWLKAAEYYCDNFDSVRSVVDLLNCGDAESIRKAKELFASTEIKTQLSYIKSNFGTIAHTITKLETPGIELIESIVSIERLLSKMDTLTRKEFSNKLTAIIARNIGFETLREIRNVLYEGTNTGNQFIENLSPAEIAMFKYAPTTSIDAERSFSIYKQVFNDRRRSFLFDNLKKHVIVQCNRSLNSE